MPEIPKLSKKKVAVVVLVVVLVILVIGSLFGQNFDKMISALIKADHKFVLLAFLGQLAFFLVWARRWDISLSAMGYAENKLKDLYLILFGSKFINNITPFSYSGGDPIVRSLLLKKVNKTSFSVGMASSIVEYIPDFVIFFAFLLAGLSMSVGMFSTWAAVFMFIITTLIIAIVIVLILALSGDRSSGKIERLIRWISEKIKKPMSEDKAKEKMDKFSEGLDSVIRDKTVFLKILSCSVLIWLTNLGILYALFLAFSVSPPLPLLFLSTTLPMLAGMIPLTPGGLGTIDATRAGVFLIFLPNSPLVVANVVLLKRLIGFVFMMIVGGGALSYLGFQIWKK